MRLRRACRFARVIIFGKSELDLAPVYLKTRRRSVPKLVTPLPAGNSCSMSMSPRSKLRQCLLAMSTAAPPVPGAPGRRQTSAQLFVRREGHHASLSRMPCVGLLFSFISHRLASGRAGTRAAGSAAAPRASSRFRRYSAARYIRSAGDPASAIF